jgi:hypothetical protein
VNQIAAHSISRSTEAPPPPPRRENLQQSLVFSRAFFCAILA